jgi:trafficking protein particle complex subunit 11
MPSHFVRPIPPLLPVVLTKISPVDSSLVFWSPDVKVGEPAVYQFSLSASVHTFISSLPFTSVTIWFNEETAPVTVLHSVPEGEVQAPLVQRVDLGQINLTSNLAQDATREVQANLRWQPGSTVVFTGALISDVPTTLTVRPMSRLLNSVDMIMGLDC